MEEEGTEVLFRPGSETIIKEHFSSQGQRGNSAQLNLLQYCTTEENDQNELNPETSSTRSRICKGEEKSSSTSSSSPSTEEEQRQELTTNRAFFPSSTRGQPSHPTPNRFESLVENATTCECDGSVSSDKDRGNEKNSNRYHPELKAALYTEGQEAVWHEDEYSTISSLYVKPEENKNSVVTTEGLPTRSQKSREKMKALFFKSRGKKARIEQPISEEVESSSRLVKIHIRTKKVSKAVLLLPPKKAGFEATEGNISDEKSNIENKSLNEENEKYASITKNSIQARRLLDTVLSGDGLDEVESKQVAKEAFNHATAARRIAHHSKNTEMESDIVDDDDGDEEAIELENIMNYLAGEGEQAALQHIRQYSINADNDEDSKGQDGQEGARYTDAIDLTMMEANNESAKTKKKRRGKFPVSGYASRAVHYLESILPKNIGNERDGDDVAAAPYDASNSEDFWSDAGMSTLGLKSDTLEYGLNDDEGGDGPNNTLDHMSLSSLNEILDGGGTISGKKNQLENSDVLNEGARCRRQLTGEPSPRATVQEIGIPRKKKNIGLPPTQPRQNRTGILGLVTPKITKANKHSSKKQQFIDVDNNSNKKWGVFFRTPRASDVVPSQPNLVLEKTEENYSEIQCHNGVSSSTSPHSAGDERNSLESAPLNTSNSSEAEQLVEVDSDSCRDMPEANRYSPACVEEESKHKPGRTNRYRTISKDNEIELKLSVATPEDQNSENRGNDDDALSENIVQSQPSSSQGKEKSETCVTDGKVRIDEKIDDRGSRDRYQTEPIGKTPRRDGLKMDENSHKEAHIRETGTQKESNLQIQTKLHAVLTIKKEEQCDQKAGGIIHQNDLNEKATFKKTVTKEGLTCDPIKQSSSSPGSKDSTQDDIKLSVVDKREEVAVKGNDEKEITHTKLKPDILPHKSDNRKKKSNATSERKKHEEISTADSVGSKSKIFGRVVDMVGRNKRKPLIPIAIVEEKYFVDKDMKKISTGVHYVHESRKPTKMNTGPTNLISEKDIHSPVLASNYSVGQRAQAISRMKEISMSSSFTLVDDSNNTVVHKAISNGNLKAVESNEEGDDVVPLNYLSIMLRKKLHQEKVKTLKSDTATNTRETHHQRSSRKKNDADSFVAAIRGPRHKEAPGVALEEIAIRKYQNNRDPITGNGINTVVIDLAPTPRRPERETPTFDDDEKEAQSETDDPSMKEDENERRRRKLITERLFQAGCSSFHEAETIFKKETSGDVIKTAPTVASAESYSDDVLQENVDPIVESNAKKEIIEKKEDRAEAHSRIKLCRGRNMLSISFLKGNKRK